MDMAIQRLTQCKLIILYILRRIDFSMTFSQLSDFILMNEYTDYFTLQAALGELTDAGLIHQELIQEVIYFTVTTEGEEALSYFENRISRYTREQIETYLKENQVRMRDETNVQADYYRTTINEYQVRCVVKERQTHLIDLTLSVPTEAQAKCICNQWKKKCTDVYGYLMSTLMNEE